MTRLITRVRGVAVPRQQRDRSHHRGPAPQPRPGNLAMQDQLRSRQPGAYRISHPQDSHEQAADNMADRAMRMKPAETADSNSRSEAPASATSSNILPGSGRPLPADVKQFFESRFGTDLSQVRIHDDAAAQHTARHINARAFTHHNHIGFDRDQYDPHTDEGRHLLAHELAHVNQQTDSNTLYCESWDVDDGSREIERELLVQLIFTDTWSDMWNGTGWTTARKNTFRSDFVSSIENTFNNSSFVIKPPPSYGDVLPQENVEQGYKPLVDIDLVPDGEWSAAEDWEVDVSSNPTGEFRTSSSSTSYGSLDEADNTAVTKEGADPHVTQIPTVHEFGHFIGLDHPGEGLEGGWFSDSQLSPGADAYTHTGTDVEGRTVHGPSDLMGTGMGLRPFYYDAWARALDEHVEELRRAAQQQQFQRDWNMFERALGNDPAGVEWFMRGISGM